MKNWLLGGALVGLYVSPVLAHDYRGVDGIASARMAQQLRGVRTQAIAPAEGVYFSGSIIGTDPDPNVRLSFQRDPEPWNR